MNQATLRNIKAKMLQALALIKEALNMSIPLFRTEQKNNIVMLWEAFAKELIGYIRYRSRETGVNLLSNISIRRIWFR